jgi:phosphate starvation-inducible PhoH-like protein
MQVKRGDHLMAKRQASKRQKRDNARDREDSSYRRKNPAQIRLPALEAQTATQKKMISMITTNSQTFAVGPAGTGKTYIAARKAADLYDQKQVRKIVISRPNTPTGRSLGFFPGTLEEKIAPWAVPVIEVLEASLGKSHVEHLLKTGKIEVAPFETMRGRTFDDAFIILDEAQNTTPHEMKMFLTRVGARSTLIVSGDVSQSDLQGNSLDGLTMALQLVAKFDLPVGVVEFTTEDVVRSDISAQWVVAFYRHEAANGRGLDRVA